jgi:hypothetical protein
MQRLKHLFAFFRQSDVKGVSVRLAVLFAMLANVAPVPAGAAAAPSAEVAKLCMRYSYVVYPYKRPGSVRMSGDRQNYFKDCVARDGKVPEPASSKS